ncbi:uncharacterized protein LOC134189209 [Corticium candelabrum]|uniref:uncharacterized protein LOC134189209 n=1 Tax=Corticium candelabrum TaxID=121492 RepID=UPI002E267159|nr:uncharacterized protein LOC134189209 [Corticium candelabrum]
MASSDLPDNPHPRSFTFPKRSFEKKATVMRSFRASWFDKWTWIHYSECIDAAFCHVCAKAEQQEKLQGFKKDLAFIRNGFSNWEDATEGFCCHEKSRCHQDAVQMIIVLPTLYVTLANRYPWRMLKVK